MRWPWSRPEVRSSSYTDQVISRLFAAAAGGTGDGSALGALETCSRLWGAGLSSARVTPTSSALAAVTPAVLDAIGRALCRTGESLFVIDVFYDRVSLIPCGSWSMSGGHDPTTWMYRCVLSGPDQTTTTTRPASAVIHCRYSPAQSSPWKGRSPLLLALDTARAAGLLERATAEEFSFVQQQILSPRRNQNEHGQTDLLTPDLIAKIVEGFSAHTGSECLVVPGDLEPRRLGPSPPPTFHELRDRFENSILSVHGLPPALLAVGGTGTAMRESFRQVLHALLRPLGLLVAEELQKKLDPAAELSFDALRAADIAGSARAFGSLVKSGKLTPQSAAAVVGFDDVEVQEGSA